MTREQYLTLLDTYTAEKNDDSTLDFIAQSKEFLDGLESLTAAAVAAKDNEWREKYRKAFFRGGANDEGGTPPASSRSPHKLTIDDLVTDRSTKYC